MATINYQFSDGHFEEIEVTEEFKQGYELLERQDLRRYWKIKQQKYRAGIGCKGVFVHGYIGGVYELQKSTAQTSTCLYPTTKRT